MQKVEADAFLFVVIGTGGMLMMVLTFIIFYIRHHQKLTMQRENVQMLELAYQRKLLEAVIQSQEDERKRIGQDLHDDVGAALSCLRLTIDMYNAAATHAESYRTHAAFCKGMIDKVINDVRNISHHLSPASLNLKGLPTALESYFHMLNKAGKIRVDFQDRTSEKTLEKLDIKVATSIYRVIEELLNNTIKHAEASLILVVFTELDHKLLIRYEDNGIGLPVDKANLKSGMGFHNIESRLGVIGAKFELSVASPGFAIDIYCPLTDGSFVAYAKD